MGLNDFVFIQTASPPPPPATPLLSNATKWTTLYHGWASPVSGCNTTYYDAVEATAAGGVFPFAAGDSLLCKAWKLAATICTVEPSVYYTSNFQCASSGGFTHPAFGTYCAVSAQLVCSSCPAECNAQCGFGYGFEPLSVRNCAGMEAAQPPWLLPRAAKARARFRTARRRSRARCLALTMRR